MKLDISYYGTYVSHKIDHFQYSHLFKNASNLEFITFFYDIKIILMDLNKIYIGYEIDYKLDNIKFFMTDACEL